jgi:hypothetical protein
MKPEKKPARRTVPATRTRRTSATKAAPSETEISTAKAEAEAPKAKAPLRRTKTAAVTGAEVTRATPKAPVRRRAARRKLNIPAILLEGDTSPAPAISGPGERYALGPTPPPAHAQRVEELGELPEAYGTLRLLLTARDPRWLYTHWDFTNEQLRRSNALSADRHLVLRVFIGSVKGKPAAEIHVHPESRHWFVPVDKGGTKYVAELGYYDKGKRWTTLSTSGATLTPPDALAEEGQVRFATLPSDVSFEQLRDVVKSAVAESVPLVEAIQQLRAMGHPELPSAEVITAAAWTPEQERALAEAVTMDQVRRVWIGSLEITELIRRRLERDISSAGAAQFSQPSSPLGGALGVSSLSAPPAKAAGKGFWFNVNAELIIYGATESDATVTIGGRALKLRPDGTFSCRFALPDGQFELPVVAVSADKTDGRGAELKFSRGTEYRGEVGAHPQDPALKPPLAENVV